MDNMEVVWERFLVGVDVAVLVDADEAELDRWPTGELYERLLLAGVPITYDPTGSTSTFGGRPDYFDLLVAVTAEVVTAHRPGNGLGEVDLLPPAAAEIVFDWYRRNVDVP
ncbi:hypothetical protein [Kutzneria buriramensis]|uniref:Uncharacterized protein n=1 Tax=Kutzneria buriramensis TaxID=1045776 RepID=A0A3E0GUL2_9PSEU|nr:hypothetical protein [Kutzneria buriramensis]REH25978.1 hypothetical protein BCF44_13517 [Kutzneria buriramensis]